MTEEADFSLREVVGGIVALVLVIGALWLWDPLGLGDNSAPSAASSSAPTSAAATVGSFDGSMTCAEWLVLPRAEQRAGSAQMIAVLHAYDQSDAFAAEFARDVTRACEPAPQLSMAEVAGGIAAMATAAFPH